MSELGKYLRMQLNGDKEIATQHFKVYGDPTPFTSGLSGDHSRRHLLVYNRNHADSGEVFIGGGSMGGDGMIIPKNNQWQDVPIAGSAADHPDVASTAVDIYFQNENSGETGYLTILEVA